MKRTIKVKLLDRTKLLPIETDVTTFGEFKKVLKENNVNIDWDSSILTDRATKSTFLYDESKLPNVDSIMFVTPTKSSFGAYSYREAIEKIKVYKSNGGNVPFNYTHAKLKDLLHFISTEIEPENKSIPDDNKDVSNDNIRLHDGKYLLGDYIITITHKDNESVDNLSNLVDITTLEDLQNEAELLKDSL